MILLVLIALLSDCEKASCISFPPKSKDVLICSKFNEDKIFFLDQLESKLKNSIQNPSLVPDNRK